MLREADAEIEIRELKDTPEDIAAVERLLPQLTQRIFSRDELPERAMEAAVDPKHYRYVVAMCGEEVVGMGQLTWHFSIAKAMQARVEEVVVDEHYRGKGIATAIVDKLIKLACHEGCTQIGLDASQAGKPVYEKLGFVVRPHTPMILYIASAEDFA